MRPGDYRIKVVSAHVMISCMGNHVVHETLAVGNMRLIAVGDKIREDESIKQAANHDPIVA